MTLSATLHTFAWLTRDTFRQARAGGILWILLVISALATVVCASASIVGDVPLAAPGENPDFLPRNDPDAADAAKLAKSGVVVASGELRLAFGMISIPLNRDAQSAVHFLELILAGGVAGTLGLLLTLVWTAGFLPGFLDTRAITVLLAKPVPRWCLLVGKYLGVLAFVLANATLFVLGTWTAIGLRTGIWDAVYLYTIVLLVIEFAMFFSVSTLLAVWFRSTVVCVFGSIVFWAFAWSINFGRHALVVGRDGLLPDSFSSSLGWLTDAMYWILPKPADMNLILSHSLSADAHFSSLFDFDKLSASGFSITLSIASSLAFAVVVLVLSSRRLAATDY
jgi:ABC-type transport system involved in multi-copper enzyme maturation permease subunit